MSIMVFGGDGYLGWPLALKLARRHPGAPIVLVDNLLRRRLVHELGGNSVTPIRTPEERLSAAREVLGITNLSFVDLDVSSPAVDALVAHHRPHLVYHLAQQASAPFSMRGVEEAVLTVQNNEIGNMRILWAVRRHVPEAHLVKLGSFGEYARCGLDVAEGYFQPSFRGKTAEVPVPYPRASDDIYHITKINDTNFISMACRKWGLTVTDVMQSTIFGAYTAETAEAPALLTRLDYDAVYGTVLNRFLTQTVVGAPMTVYGTGLQRTGLMALDDSLGSLVELGDHPARAGEHRVINHVTERDFSVIEIAELIAHIANEQGYSPRILRGHHDPRVETDAVKLDYHIDTDYVETHLRPTPIGRVLAEMFPLVARHRDRIDPAVFPPTIRW